MKGQTSIEYILIISAIIVVIVLISAVLYSKTNAINTALLNESAQYQVVSASFNINQSGIMYGEIQLSRYANISAVNVSFSSSNSLFSNDFSVIGKNTSYGYTMYLTQNSITSFSSYLYSPYLIKYIKYSNGKKTYFISSNYSGYFN
jgi:hypothetical protein